MIRLDPRRLLFDREVMGLMGLSLLVKPIGLLSQVLVARWFGAGEDVDAYGLALFLVTFGDGTLSQVFRGAMAPYLIQLKHAVDIDTFHRYQNGVLGLFIGGGAAWLLGLAALVAAVLPLVWPDLPPITSDLTIRMTVAMALPGLLLVVNNLGMSVLNLYQYFRVAGAMPVLNAAAMLAALVLWHDRLGIWSLPLGFAIGQVLQWPVIHLRAFAVRALRPVRPGLDRRDLGRIRDLIWLMFVGQVLLTGNAFVDRWFATALEPGSVASLNFAYTLVTFGFMLFSTSLVTVMYPHMSETIAAGEFAACSEYIRHNLVRLCHLVVPASLGIAFAAPELVRVLFERGAFDAADTVRTTGAMVMYMLGLPALIINGLVARIFHSLQLLRDKVWLAVQFLVTNALLNFALIGPLQVRGLALASSLAINLHLLLSLWVLHRRRSGLYTGPLLAVVGQSYVVGALAAAVYWALPLERSLADLADRGFGGAVAAGAIKAAIVVAAYGVVLGCWRLAARRRASS